MALQLRKIASAAVSKFRALFVSFGPLMAPIFFDIVKLFSVLCCLKSSMELTLGLAKDTSSTVVNVIVLSGRRD